jgi:hypothetical protein
VAVEMHLSPRFQMIERPILRLIIGIGLPIVSALVMEQLPKTRVAEVPFAFQVEQQTLPPGAYSVKQLERGQGVRIQNERIAGLDLKCEAAKHIFGKPQGARLVFENYEGRYFLSEIWFDADGRGLVLPQDQVKAGAGSKSDEREVRYVRFQ